MTSEYAWPHFPHQNHLPLVFKRTPKRSQGLSFLPETVQQVLYITVFLWKRFLLAERNVIKSKLCFLLEISLIKPIQKTTKNHMKELHLI